MEIDFKQDSLRGFEIINRGKKVTSILYEGKSLSLNSFYVGGHFSRRAKIKKEFKGYFNILFEKAKGLRFMDKFFVVMYCNNRLDTDNNIGLEKVFMDTLNELGYIKDDNKKYFKALFIFTDGNLPSNSTEFVLYEIKD